MKNLNNYLCESSNDVLSIFDLTLYEIEKQLLKAGYKFKKYDWLGGEYVGAIYVKGAESIKIRSEYTGNEATAYAIDNEQLGSKEDLKNLFKMVQLTSIDIDRA